MVKRLKQVFFLLLGLLVVFSSVLPSVAHPLLVNAEETKVWRFDFGTGSSPVAEGHQRVSNTTIYSPELGFGLNKRIEARDRSYSAPVLRDFVIDTGSAKNYTFRVDLPNGKYEVKVVAGDAIASNKTAVTVETVDFGSTSTGSGKFQELTGVVNVIDGKMLFEISGSDSRLNGIEIIQVEESDEDIKITDIIVNGAGGREEVRAGNTLQMEATIKPNNASYPWLTWEVFETDGSETQLASIDSGGLLQAKLPGKVKVVASATDGSGVKGEKMITILPSTTPAMMYDFGTNSSSVQTGYTKVADSTLYTYERGYGINRRVDSRDRSHSDALLRDFIIDREDYTFRVDLANGTYAVKVIAGDAAASNETAVIVENINLGTMKTGSGEFAELSGEVEVTEQKLVFTITGKDRRLNGIEIIPIEISDEIVPVTDVFVNSADGKDKVNEGEKLQMVANVLPAFAQDQSVEWSVVDAAGKPTNLAEISKSGLLSANHWGVVKVIATSNSNPEVNGEKTITIQTNRSIPEPEAVEITDYQLYPNHFVKLRWNKVDEAVQYRIYRQTNKGDFQKIGNTKTTSFTDETALPGFTYTYAVTTIIDGIGKK